MSTTLPIQRLSQSTSIDPHVAEPPETDTFELPEKVLQFGTGAFLRGFSNDFIDRANRRGAFAGRIVVVGSTGSGRVDLINQQDGLYTLCVRGVDNGDLVDRTIVISSMSRAIAASHDWGAVLDFARSRDLEFVISNTTEVGIRMDPDDRIEYEPPRSFPGKLTTAMYARARAFDYDANAGLTILCCELVENNAQKLRSMVLELATRWGLGDEFVDWIRKHNRFCNTLVDRIVSGRPDEERLNDLMDRLGYRDDLLIQAEPYRLWAIEGDADLERRLGFARDEDEIVVAPDISPYRERKVRILNGTHTIMVPLCYLCGKDTVAESMDDARTFEYVRKVMMDEIVPVLDLPHVDTAAFAEEVLDRFRNPFVRHNLLSIALHQTSKMDVRVVPSLFAYNNRMGRLPVGLSLGFSAFLQFVTRGGRAADAPAPADERAERIRSHWDAAGSDRVSVFVREVCADRELWCAPLDRLPNFVEHVTENLNAIIEFGALHRLEQLLESSSP